MMHVGDILSTVGDVQYHGDIMMHVGDIMSTMGVFSTVGENLLLFEYPHGTEHPTVLMISPTCIMTSPTVLKLQRMVSPTVLNNP